MLSSVYQYILFRWLHTVYINLPYFLVLLLSYVSSCIIDNIWVSSAIFHDMVSWFLLPFCIALSYFTVCSINLTCCCHCELFSCLWFHIFCSWQYFIYALAHMSYETSDVRFVPYFRLVFWRCFSMFQFMFVWD